MQHNPSDDNSSPLARSAVLVHVIAWAAMALSLTSSVFINTFEPEEHQVAFALSGVALVSFFALMIWSLVLAARSIYRQENSVLSVGIFYMLFVEGIFAIILKFK